NSLAAMLFGITIVDGDLMSSIRFTDLIAFNLITYGVLPGRRDWQEFGDPLDDRNDDQLKQCHGWLSMAGEPVKSTCPILQTTATTAEVSVPTKCARALQAAGTSRDLASR
ncbi:MAG: hypothetical protein AAFY51_12030, partial [Pseudomonadota bacterium]